MLLLSPWLDRLLPPCFAGIVWVQSATLTISTRFSGPLNLIFGVRVNVCPAMFWLVSVMGGRSGV